MSPKSRTPKKNIKSESLTITKLQGNRNRIHIGVVHAATIPAFVIFLVISTICLDEASNAFARAITSIRHGNGDTQTRSTERQPIVAVFRPENPDGMTFAQRRLAVQAAVEYLSHSPTAAQILHQMASETNPIRIRVSRVNDDTYDTGTDMVTWNPNLAARGTNGSTQSPSIGLIHEIGHALARRIHRGIADATMFIPMWKYGDVAEWAVISRIETPISRELGEGVRTDHSGENFWVDEPTQRKPTREVTLR